MAGIFSQTKLIDLSSLHFHPLSTLQAKLCIKKVYFCISPQKPYNSIADRYMKTSSFCSSWIKFSEIIINYVTLCNALHHYAIRKREYTGDYGNYKYMKIKWDFNNSDNKALYDTI